MTEAERAGFDFAIDRLRLFSAQLIAGADRLSDRPEDAIAATPRELAKDRFKTVDDLARCLQAGFAR